MSLVSEHSGDDSYQFSLSRGPSLLDKHSLVSAESKGKDDYKYTMAYEKGLMKEKCGLCKMFFHRNSVNYKVPNRRIFALERKWNVKREGRRYTNAAFLYKMVDVCCFCSQFFKIMPEDLPVLDPKEPPPKPMKLDIKTMVERTDIAHGQRAYQSSSVDGRTADMAVQQPYEKCARTRREVDPWWEVDFSRSYHVHSLSFLISTGKHQKLRASVFLLDKPYGFEDPFIDGIKNKASASITEIIPESDQSVMKRISWEFPENTTCFAIRVQLQGIHSLCIQEFKVLQGDNLVPTSEDDFVMTMVSYSSLSPTAVRAGYLEMMSPEEKKELIKENDPYIHADEKLKAKHITVGMLALQIKRKKNRIRQWKEKVRGIAALFPPDEVESLYRVIFKPTLEAKPSLRDTSTINEQELLDGALVQHYPRADLGELQTRLRSVVRWIQTRSHLKLLGALANSHNFDIVANDPNEHVQKLQSAFKKVELTWAKLELQEERMKDNAKDLGFVGTKVSEARGCSWSQFLIVISLFCTLKCKQIPETAFYLDTLGAADAAGLHLLGGVCSPGDDSTIISDNGHRSGLGGGHSHTHSHATLSPPAATKGMNPETKNWLDRMATSLNHNPPVVEIEKKSILQQAREVELFPYYNSSFAEYKFWHFQRRTALQNIDFPPDLSLEFARTLNPKRASTSHGRSSLPSLGSLGSTIEGSGAADTDDASVRSGFSGVSGMDLQQGSGMRGGAQVQRPNTTQRMTLNTGAGGPVNILPATPARKLRSRPTTLGKLDEGAMVTTAPNTPGNKLLSASMSSLEGHNRSAQNLLRPSTSQANLNATPTPVSRPQTTGTANLRSKQTTGRAGTGGNDEAHSINSFDFMSFGDSSKEEKVSLSATTIDFFRVCSLCELKFPRDCMEIKVMRKHVVSLRYDAYDKNSSVFVQATGPIGRANAVCMAVGLLFISHIGYPHVAFMFSMCTGCPGILVWCLKRCGIWTTQSPCTASYTCVSSARSSSILTSPMALPTPCGSHHR